MIASAPGTSHRHHRSVRTAYRGRRSMTGDRPPTMSHKRRFPAAVATIAVIVGAFVATGSAAGAAANTCEFWVAPPPTGDDAHAGTATAPWATLQHAADAVPDSGCTVWIADGTYAGRVEFERRFTLPTTFKAANAYGATFEHSSIVLDVDGARNVVIEGLEIRHSGPGADGVVVDVDEGDDQWAEDIVLRNNIIHDSHDNDLLKIHRRVRFTTVQGNLFYNQGPDEQHVDLNSVTDVTIEDNVFFNDYAASGRSPAGDEKHFVLVKDPNVAEDGLIGSQRIAIRRNVFFNWQGGNEIFVKAGNDGNPIHEAIDVWVENNLFIGNSDDYAVAPFGVAGAKNVSFTNNTVVGDLPSKAFAFKIEIKGDNPRNENIEFVNNIWVDPTGTMGSDGEDDNKFAEVDPESTDNLVLDTNLYWNGDAPIPPGELINPLVDDANAVVADPMLETDHSSIVTPVWTGAVFADGSESIREVFESLVAVYGSIPEGSPVVGAADAGAAPADDILGNTRSDPDLGAYEVGAPSPPPSSSGVFVDDDGNIHEGYIEAIAAAGITKGCNPPVNDRFCPDGFVTRGQMAAFIARARQLPPPTTDPFGDDEGSIFEEDINRLAEAGITKGCNPPINDRFCPTQIVTRDQMAAFLVRAYGHDGAQPEDRFVDDTGSIFEQDINRLAAADITKGCNPPANDRYCPDGAVRRDQMASFLGRAEGLTPTVLEVVWGSGPR